MWQTLFICVTWRIHRWDFTQYFTVVCDAQQYDITHCYVWQDWMTDRFARWLISLLTRSASTHSHPLTLRHTLLLAGALAFSCVYTFPHINTNTPKKHMYVWNISSHLNATHHIRKYQVYEFILHQTSTRERLKWVRIPLCSPLPETILLAFSLTSCKTRPVFFRSVLQCVAVRCSVLQCVFSHWLPSRKWIYECVHIHVDTNMYRCTYTQTFKYIYVNTCMGMYVNIHIHICICILYIHIYIYTHIYTYISIHPYIYI